MNLVIEKCEKYHGIYVLSHVNSEKSDVLSMRQLPINIT